jgi:hypothetical protein
MYVYESEKKYVFTDKGQKHFLQIRDLVHKLLNDAGAFEMGKAMKLGSAGAATTWEMMACVDRLVEIGEIEEVPRGPNTAGQNRLFVKAK